MQVGGFPVIYREQLLYGMATTCPCIHLNGVLAVHGDLHCLALMKIALVLVVPTPLFCIEAQTMHKRLRSQRVAESIE